MEEIKGRQKVAFLVLAFLLCALVVFNSFVISRFGLKDELGVYVELLGVMTVLQILLAVFLTTISKSGYYYAAVLFSVETVIVAVRMLIAREMSLPPCWP